MANASVSSVSQTDSASAKSDSRKRFALGNGLGQSQSVQSILFDTLFTSQFFESALTQTSGEPNAFLAEPVALEPVSRNENDQHRESETNSIKEEATTEGSREVAEENAAASIIALAYQPTVEPVQEQIDSTEVEPICIVKCYAPQEQNTTETSTADLPVDTVLPSVQSAHEETNARAIETEATVSSTDASPEVQFAINAESKGIESHAESRQRSKKDDREEKDSIPIVSADKEANAIEGELPFNRQEEQDFSSKYESNSDAQSDGSNELEPQVQLAKYAEQTAPVLNRRAERLAENKHGEALHRESTKDGYSGSVEPTLSSAGTDREAVLDTFAQTKPNVPEMKLDQSTQGASMPVLPTTGNTPTVAQPIGNKAPSKNLGTVNSTLANVAGAAVSKVTSLPTTTTPNVGATGSVTTLQPAGKSSNGTSGTTSYQRLDRSAVNESLTVYQQTRLLQRVLKGLERFGDGSSTVRLRLHPPELGALEMSLHMNQQQLSATVIVDSESVQQVLQDNLQQLQSKLTEQGITIEKFEFRVQTTQESNAAGDNSQQFSSSDGQAGADRDSRQGREFGQARSNWLQSQISNENGSLMVDVDSHPGQRWIAASNINIRA